MRKKPPQPPLTIVGSSIANPLAPPAALGKAGADLWRAIMAEYDIDDSGGRQILLQSCAAADRAFRMRFTDRAGRSDGTQPAWSERSSVDPA